MAILGFSSVRKCRSSIVTGIESNNTLLLKGAPEAVVENSSTYKLADGTQKSLSQDDKKKIMS